MVNGGYIVRAKLFDTHFNLLKALIENGYLEESRTKPVPIKFQLLASEGGKFPESATRPQIAILASVHGSGGSTDSGRFEFVAIDPPSWFLNTGDGAGAHFQGKVSSVIRQVVNRYAPAINLEIGETVDSEYGQWWMMRQDPKTFISSLMDWSSSVTQRKTHWLIAADGTKLVIKEQAQLPSNRRAFLPILGRGSIRYYQGLGILVGQCPIGGPNQVNYARTCDGVWSVS